MERVFVTGGSGFVGGALLRELAARGIAAKALARSDRSAEIVAELGAEVVRGDLGDAEALRAGCEGCDVVIHSAAKVELLGRWADFEDVNVGGTGRVVQAAKAAEVPRLVHVSTEAVLVGGRPIHGADETWPLPEKPLGHYPRSKGMAEEVVRAGNGDGLATIIARPRLVWGAGDTTLLPEIARAVEEGRFLWMNGGRYPTSTCHVRNVVAGLLACAERGVGGETYFLTDGEAIEMREMLTRMLSTVGVDPGSRSVPTWLAKVVAAVGEAVWAVLPLGGEPPLARTAVRLLGEQVTVDDAKARREIGYVPVVTREQGLAEMGA